MFEARVEQAYDRIARADRPEVWISLRPFAQVAAEARAVDPSAPLAGQLFAVKGNIDVAGLPTTAGCPSFGQVAERDAQVVARLRAAGAVPVGTTNLDQFATGLVGTRSPYGVVRNALHRELIAGGSSSGSAVAVALGLVDFALGTDTAGSGRVPAAFNGVVGLKPTYGMVPTDGVVPACRSLDCVSVFAPTLSEARRVFGTMATGRSSGQRRPGAWRVAVPSRGSLGALAPGWEEQFQTAARVLASAGVELLDLSPQPFLEAADLLYGGAFVAERYAAVGTFVEQGSPDLDPAVAKIITDAGRIPAHRYAEDRERLASLRLAAMTALGDADALLLPTTPEHPTLAQVEADPFGVNARLGRFTNSTNLFGMCAVAVPAGTVGGRPFGVMVLGRPGADDTIASIAQHLVVEPTIRLAVAGAHLSGQPLNHQLTDRLARLASTTATAPAYRLYALPTEPAKPGLVRVPHDGTSIEVELWDLPAHHLATLLAALPRPLALGEVELRSGETATGFLATPEALPNAEDITHHGGWRTYLKA